MKGNGSIFIAIYIIFLIWQVITGDFVLTTWMPIPIGGLTYGLSRFLKRFN